MCGRMFDSILDFYPLCAWTAQVSTKNISRR